MPGLSTSTMAWVAGGGIAVYVGAILYALLAPRRRPSPQDGVAVGCLMIALVPGVALAILLAVGLSQRMDGLVRVLFYVTVLPLGYALVMAIAMGVMKWRKRRNAWPTEPEDHFPPAAEG